MKYTLFEIQKCLFVSIDLYKQFKDTKIEFDDYELTQEDKKYLCLYFGVLYSDNKISRLINKQNNLDSQKYTINNLNYEEYIQIYNESFEPLLSDKCFKSIYNYFKFLLGQDIIKRYNLFDKIDVDVQKRLIKE